MEVSKKQDLNPPQDSAGMRDMEHMLTDLNEFSKSDAARIQTEHGWKHCLMPGVAYRHDYNEHVAKGGWEFYTLGNGICLITVDMTTTTELPLRHSSQDNLVLSAVIMADVDLYDQTGPIGALTNGYCTYYGLKSGEEFSTIYESGKKLQWVSVFLDRATLYDSLGLTANDIPKNIRDFIDGGGHLPHTNIILTPTAHLAAQQLLECPFSGGFKKAFLKSKTQELACHILFALSNELEPEINDTHFTSTDYKKIYRAMRYLKNDLDEPANIPELAYAVGLTRQKLQMGFKLVFGNTVAKIRDNLRMEYALERIRNSDVSIIQIALETGYEHPASFTRAFKAAYGTTPATMRKTARELLLISERSHNTIDE